MSSSEWIYGQHAVAAVLDARPEAIVELWLQQSNQSHRTTLARAKQVGVPIQRVSAETLRQHTQDGTHQGIAARVRTRPTLREQDLEALIEAQGDACRLLVLDGVTDPHNLGSCLRVAEAAGISAVIAPSRRQASLSGSVYKSASGSAERVPLIHITNLARTLEYLKRTGIWLYVTCGDAETSIWETRFQSPWAMVLGSEGEGVRARTQTLCDFRVRIPMLGQVESLNVSTAAAALLFEAQRQQREPST